MGSFLISVKRLCLQAPGFELTVEGNE